MKRWGGVVLVVLGLALLALGLLFMVGSGGQVRRLIVAGLGLGLGALSTGFGVRFFRQAQRCSPEYLRAEILHLARQKNGELSHDDLAAALGARMEHAAEPIGSLLSSGACQKNQVDGRDYYLFPQLQPRLVVRRCEFCSAELPLAEELSACPNCGGTIRTGVARVALSGEDVYDMDE